MLSDHLYFNSLSNNPISVPHKGFPGGSGGKEFVYNAGDQGSIPGSGRFPGEREWLITPVFLPGEFHRQCLIRVLGI